MGVVIILSWSLHDDFNRFSSIYRTNGPQNFYQQNLTIEADSKISLGEKVDLSLV